MMLRDKRKTDRFDRPFFIQFRQLDSLVSYSLGLTSNISSEGCCFQYKDIALERGDNLELRLNKPQTNQAAQFMGDVIWLQKNGEQCTAGIEFRASNKKNKKEMIRIISDFFSIPAELLRNRSKRNNSFIFTRNRKAAAGSDDTAVKEYRSGALTNRGMKIGMHMVMILVIAALLVLFIPLRTVNDEETTGEPVVTLHDDTGYGTFSNDLSLLVTEIRSVKEITHNQDESDRSIITDEHSTSESPQASGTLIEQDDKGVLSQALPDPVISEPYTFYVQVASLQDPDAAYQMLKRVRHYYPEANLFNINNFYKLRIPGIHTKEQGAEIIKDIEKKLDMQATLVYRVK